MPAAPVVSVIIATYNWSAALHCALRSVLRQTFADFEVLVVGDACTDDSADIVRAFGDPRLRWFNLPQRAGSQYGPNNFGLSQACGEFVAYLGHDDIWWPTHLASALRTVQAKESDIVAGATIMYGPDGSGVYAITGLFPADVFHPAYFFVPSSMVHRRALLDKVTGWRSAEAAGRAPDVDFVQRCFEAGARIDAVNELTVFKFNAAWRRNAYRKKSTREQEAVLARIESGDDFRHLDLLKVLRAGIEDRLHRVEGRNMTTSSGEAATQELTRRYKGADFQKTVAPLELTRRVRQYMDADAFAGHHWMGYQWHGLEEAGKPTAFRWSGPSTTATIELPYRIDRPCEIAVHVVNIIEARLWETVSIAVNGISLPHRRTVSEAGRSLLSVAYDPAGAGTIEEPAIVTLTIGHTRRPIDLGINDDRRWLGLAVNWVEIAPLPKEAKVSECVPD